MNLAYVAGLFDGEGCVNFTKCRNIKIPRVCITNTNLEILESLQKSFGGFIQKGYRPQKHWKQSYHWTISNAKACEFLTKIYAWVCIKKEQIWLVWAWDAIRPGSGRNWDQNMIDALNLINEQSKWLNWKGVDRPVVSPIDQCLKEF